MTVTANIHPNLSAWTGSATPYSVGNRRSNDTSPVKCYECITAGNGAASGGPTGTGSSIADGTAVWKYVASVDYTSLSAWQAAMGTISAPNIGLLYRNDSLANTAVSVSTTPTFNNGGVSSTNTITLKPAPGEGFQDYLVANPSAAYAYNAVAGVAFSNSRNYTSGSTILVNCAWMTVAGIQFDHTGTGTASAVYYGAGSVGAHCTLDSVIVRRTTIGTDGGATDATFTAQTCLYYINGTATGMLFGNAHGTVRNCTFARTSNNAAGGTGMGFGYTGTGQNNAIFGFTTPLSGASATFDHTGTDQASASGSSNAVSVPFTTATFKAVGSSPDFRLVSGSALIDAGSTAEAPAIDAIGTARPQGSAADIGAWEYAASGTAIFMDFGAGTEWLASLVANDLLPGEVISTQRADRLLTHELLAATRGDGMMAAEAMASATVDASLGNEFLASSRSDGAAATEWHGSLQLFVGAPLEFGAALRLDGLLAAEMLAGVLRDTGLVDELLAGQRSDGPLSVEWSGAAVLSIDWPLPIEWRGGVRFDATAPGEFLSALRRDYLAPGEVTARVTFDAPLPVELLRLFRSDEMLPVEIAAGASSLQADGHLAIEWRAAVAADARLPIEWAGNAVIVAHGKAIIVPPRDRVFTVAGRRRTWKIGSQY